MNHLTCIIIDDEKNAREGLQMLIKNFAAEVEVLKLCKSANEGINAITELNPDLIFLDVEMPHMTGFEMLEKIHPKNFDVIFTTAYDHYALKAIKFSALDYLLKPISPEDLIAAIDKHSESKKQSGTNPALELLLKAIKVPHQPLSKIALPSVNGLVLVPVENIIRCESDSNYTHFYLSDKSKFTVAKTLKEYDELLNSHNFFRIHASHIVNLNKIKKYVRGEGGYVVMDDGSHVDVSARKKVEFLKRLEEK